MTGQKATLSNYGNNKDICAPGEEIYSTLRGNTYGRLSGTSMSCAQVTAVVAMMYAVNPYMTPVLSRNILHATATDLGSAGFDNYTAYGLLNAEAAIKMAIVANTRITGVYIPNNDHYRILSGAMLQNPISDGSVTYQCTVIDYSYSAYGTPQFPYVYETTDASQNGCSFVPSHPGTYGFCWRTLVNGVITSEYGATHNFSGNSVSSVNIYIPNHNANPLSFGAVYNALNQNAVNITWYEYQFDSATGSTIVSASVLKSVNCIDYIDNWLTTWITPATGKYWIMVRVRPTNNPNDEGLCWGVEIINGVVQ